MKEGCPNPICVHLLKNFEQLKKDFPYFNCKTRKDLQESVCELCASEWNIPRFKYN